MDIIIDFEAFRGDNGEYIIKELAYCTPGDMSVGRFTFLPPPLLWNVLSEKAKYRAVWTTEKLHGMMWTDGIIPYFRLKEILHTITAPFPNVWVKGPEKRSFIADALKKKVTSLHCQKMELLPPLTSQNCPCHPASFVQCAVNKVLKFGRYMKENDMVNIVKPWRRDLMDESSSEEDEEEELPEW